MINYQENCIFVSPYKSDQNNPISIFIKSLDDNNFEFHDNGKTLTELFSRGMNLYPKHYSVKNQLLLEICKKYEINIDGWVIKRSSTKDNVGSSIIEIIEAIKAISNLYYLHQMNFSDLRLQSNKSLLIQYSLINLSPVSSISRTTSVHTQ